MVFLTKPEGVLCPDGNPEQGMTTASSRETEPCSPLTSSSSCHRSLPKTQCLYFTAAKVRTCKCVSGKDIFICILVILVITLIAVLIAAKRTDQWSCGLASAAHCSIQCPHQWIGYEGKCYFFSEEKRNWTSSQAFCSVYNASLASFEQEEKMYICLVRLELYSKQDFVMRIKGEGTYWTGFKKMPDQSWVWPNGAKAVLKDTGGSDCVYLDSEVSFSGCHAELPFICSKAAGCTDS